MHPHRSSVDDQLVVGLRLLHLYRAAWVERYRIPRSGFGGRSVVPIFHGLVSIRRTADYTMKSKKTMVILASPGLNFGISKRRLIPIDCPGRPQTV